MIWIRFDGKSQRGSEHHCWREFPNMTRTQAINEAAKYKPYDLDWTAKATNDRIEITGVHEAYKSEYNIFFDSRTHNRIVNVLHLAIMTGERLRLHYGDVKTLVVDKVVEGSVKPSLGKFRLPMLFYNSRTQNGAIIHDHAILKITDTSKQRKVIFDMAQQEVHNNPGYVK